MPRRNLEDHRALALRIINARLAAEVRMCHLRVLQTHEAEIFAESEVQGGGEQTARGPGKLRRHTSYARRSSIRAPLGEVGCCIRGLGIRLGIC